MALPAGWEAKTAGGRIVYINHIEKKTQYEDPRPLPTGWSTAVDPTSGRQVFIDHTTQATTWLDPRPPPFLSDAPPASAAPPSYAAANGAAATPAYNPAVAGSPPPVQYSQPVYVQPAAAVYGGVQSSSANTSPPGQYAQPAFATPPAGYAQPQYVQAQYAAAPKVAVVVVPATPMGISSAEAAQVASAASRRWPRRWMYGLCDCHHGPPLLFCRSCFCPCWVHTEVTAMRKGRKELRDGDAFGNCIICCCCGWAWTFVTCTERMNTRQTFAISQCGDFCTDCCLHCCCWGCAHTQEWLEVRTRKGYMPIPPGLQIME